MTTTPATLATGAITPVPDYLELPAEYAGAGVSFEPEDLPQSGPYIRPLQTNSHAVDPHDPDYIPGAEPGRHSSL